MWFWALWLTAATFLLVLTDVEAEVVCFSCEWEESGNGRKIEENDNLPRGFEKGKNGTGEGQGRRFRYDSSCGTKVPDGTEFCTYSCAWSIYSSSSGKTYKRGCGVASAPSNGCKTFDHVVCYCDKGFCNDSTSNTDGDGEGGGGGGSSSSSRPSQHKATISLTLLALLLKFKI